MYKSPKAEFMASLTQAMQAVRETMRPTDWQRVSGVSRNTVYNWERNPESMRVGVNTASMMNCVSNVLDEKIDALDNERRALMRKSMVLKSAYDRMMKSEVYAKGGYENED